MELGSVFREVFKVYCNEYYGCLYYFPSSEVEIAIDQNLMFREKDQLVLTTEGRKLIGDLSPVELVRAAYRMRFKLEAVRLMRSCTASELSAFFEFLPSDESYLCRKARKCLKELLQLEDCHRYWLSFVYAYNEMRASRLLDIGEDPSYYYEQIPLSATLKRLHDLDFFHTFLMSRLGRRIWVYIKVTTAGNRILASRDPVEIAKISMRFGDDHTASFYVRLLPVERLPEFLASDRVHVASVAKEMLGLEYATV